MSRLASLHLTLGLLALVAADAAMGQAGGGSSDYGGGGSGDYGGGGSGGGSSDYGGGGRGDYGGGGFGGGGRDDFGARDGAGGGDVDPVFLAIIGGLVLLVLAAPLAVPAGRRQAERLLSRVTRRLRGKRVRQVELAAVEAAEEDDRFAPERVRAAAEDLYRQVQQAWDERDRARLAALLGRDLLVEWERRLDDFDDKGWHSRVEVLGGVQTEYVGLTNREGTADDRVVIYVEALLKAYVQTREGLVRRIRRNDASDDDTVRLGQYWTLGARDGRWVLLSIEESSEGEHHLSAPIVGVPWSDDRLRDDALIEMAAADKLPPGFEPGELVDVDFEEDAQAAALDLSLVDARFMPAVLDATARGVVAAWAEAIDGDDAALGQVASEPALRTLLHANDESGKSRLVVRGPRVRRIDIAALDAGASPATMTLEVELAALRYVEDRDTKAVLSGSRDEETVFSERWTLSLDGPDKQPWRITRAS
ncbi:MAG TPA: TIM44-like domain-containing protein [Gaiellaceae bacterium]|nr:TIM44-like domain-containing protein [Gaiellaceae bacterium]